MISILILNSISFLLILLLFKKKWKRISQEEEGRFFIIILIVSLILVTLILSQQGYQFLAGLRECFFTVISIISTTGYGNVDYDAWPNAAKFVILFLMILGGCAGSTSGGLKVSRFLLFLKIYWQEIIKTFRPNQYFTLKMSGAPLKEERKMRTMFYIAMIFVVAIFSMIIVSFLEPKFDLITIMSSVVSTLFNIELPCK